MYKLKRLEPFFNTLINHFTFYHNIQLALLLLNSIFHFISNYDTRHKKKSKMEIIKIKNMCTNSGFNIITIIEVIIVIGHNSPPRL